MGRANNRLPDKIVIKKLNKMTCVVDNEIFFFTILSLLVFDMQKGTCIPFSQLVPYCSFCTL